MTQKPLSGDNILKPLPEIKVHVIDTCSHGGYLGPQTPKGALPAHAFDGEEDGGGGVSCIRGNKLVS
jgi:hypothetical protein